MNLSYIPANKVSTPVYDGPSIIGRDFPDGSWFRTFEKGGSFFFNGEDPATGPIDGGPYKTRAAASRCAIRLLPKVYTRRQDIMAKRKGG